MPVWFLVLLVIIVLVAALLAVAMAYRGRASAGGQNTTIIEREPRANDSNVTVIESD